MWSPLTGLQKGWMPFKTLRLFLPYQEETGKPVLALCLIVRPRGQAPKRQLISIESSLASIDRRPRCTQHIRSGQQIRLSNAFCICPDCHIRESMRFCDSVVLRCQQIFLPVSIYYMMIIKRQIDSLGSLTSSNAHTQHARRDRNLRQSYRLM